MSDFAAFLRAVIANPGDDLPRLIFADWLDEHGEPDRAELIRVQCRLAELTDNRTRDECQCPRCIEIAALRTRTERLIIKVFPPAHPWAWFPGAALWGVDIAGMVDRGFITRVPCRLSDWLERGPAVVREHPITEVRITDREPWSLARNNIADGYTWREVSLAAYNLNDTLPERIWRRLGAPGRRAVRWPVYPDRDAAMRDLGNACTLWAKDQPEPPEAALIPPEGQEVASP